MSSWNDKQRKELGFWRGRCGDVNREGYSDHWYDKARKLYDVHKQGDVVIEIGVGPVPIADPSIIGIDPLSSQFRKVGYNNRFETVTAMGEQLPIKTCGVDVVYSFNCLDHVENPDLIIKEIHRALKVNGIFKFQVDIRNYYVNGELRTSSNSSDLVLHNPFGIKDMMETLLKYNFNIRYIKEDKTCIATSECYCGLIGECYK